jgi:penicillin V acylase-like amidase (Ntn superfamily)
MAMSLLLVWHSVAIVVAAAPDSAIARAATSLFQPYLSLFRLQNEWSFYAPDVRVEPEFHYVIEDASGQQHIFVPADKLSRYLPTDIWVKDWYIHVMDNADTYGKFVAAYLCREHASLHPVSITLLELDQKDFLPQDQLSGKTPFDSEFREEKKLATVQCSNG